MYGATAFDSTPLKSFNEHECSMKDATRTLALFKALNFVFPFDSAFLGKQERGVAPFLSNPPTRSNPYRCSWAQARLREALLFPEAVVVMRGAQVRVQRLGGVADAPRTCIFTIQMFARILRKMSRTVEQPKFVNTYATFYSSERDRLIIDRHAYRKIHASTQ